MNRSVRPGIALLIALALTAGVAEAQTKINPGWNMFSAQQDVEIGAQSAQQAEQQLPILNDREVEAYINRIGQKLAVNAGGPNFQYRFRVVNASDINAFALPGGFIYINRGIIENARNEGEIAGVVAHEIAHSALRHGTHQASKAYAAQAGLQILGGLLGGKVGNNTAQILNTVGGVGLNALFLKFSRELETQADVRGAQILAASGYSPSDMISFFDQLAKVDKSRKTTWLSHHPAPPDRQARIQKESQLLRVTQNPTTNTQQLAQIKNELRQHGTARPMGEIAQRSANNGDNGPMTSSTGNGSVGRVEAPSSSWRTFRNRSGAYEIAYPSNWRVYDSGGFGVTIAPEGGVGNVGNKTEIVYGVMVNHYDPFGNTPRSYLQGTQGGNRQTTLQDATNDLLAQIRQSSPHLRVINGSGQQFNLDGKTAMSAALRGTNPNTRIAERVTVVTRALPDGHLIYTVFVTPEQEASRYSNVLTQIVQSINVNDTHAH